MAEFRKFKIIRSTPLPQSRTPSEELDAFFVEQNKKQPATRPSKPLPPGVFLGYKAVNRFNKTGHVMGEYRYASKSNSHKSYTVLVYKDGSMSCDCRGWTMKRERDTVRGCTHTRETKDKV